MNEETQPTVWATVGDVHGGQVAVGSGIVQSLGGAPGGSGPAGVDELRALLADLARRVDEESPPARRPGARERLDELDDALTAAPPDLTTIEYVTRWFSRHLPGLARAVLTVVAGPVAAAVVETAGEGMAEELRRRLGG